MKRTLNLRSEQLCELTPAELDSVAGGTKPSYDCTDYCWSLAQCPIPTLPVRECFVQTK